MAPEVLEDDPWFANEVTASESADDTAERLRRAEEEAAVFEAAKRAAIERNKRETLESPIPSFLATSTQELELDDSLALEPDAALGADAEDGAPVATVTDVVTRQIGVDRSPPDGVGGASTTKRPRPVAIDHEGATAARIRATDLVDQCRAAFGRRHLADAAAAAEEALREGEAAPPPGIAEVIEPARPLFERVFAAHVGPDAGIPLPAMAPALIAARSLDHRTGFLLSRMDGSVSVETLFEIAGMSRFASLRTLSALLRDGLIKFV